MAGHFIVTYDVVTPESAEHGDFAETGYETDTPVSLRSAIAMAGGNLEDCGRWFGTIDSDTNYRTGEETRYAIHPPKTITASSYRRVARILTGRNRR